LNLAHILVVSEHIVPAMSVPSCSTIDPQLYQLTTRLRDTSLNAPADEILSFREAELASLGDGDETLFPAEFTFEQFIQMIRFFDAIWLSFDVFVCSQRQHQLSEEWENVYTVMLFPTLRSPGPPAILPQLTPA
jgi:hypothetical protein